MMKQVRALKSIVYATNSVLMRLAIMLEDHTEFWGFLKRHDRVAYILPLDWFRNEKKLPWFRPSNGNRAAQL